MRFALLLLPALLRAGDVRIGVLGLFHPREVSVSVSRLLVAGESLTPAQPLLVREDHGQLLLQTGTRTYRVRSASAKGAPLSIEIPGKIKRQYTGTLELQSQSGELVMAIIVDLERAVATSVAAESPHAPAEAAKTQAVLARSYYLAAPHRHSAFDFCDTTHCQLFQDPPMPRAIMAAESTRGELLRYQDRPVDAMFFRSCGGRTLSAEAAGLNRGAFPYVRVSCEACARQPVRWQTRVPAEEAEALLAGERSEKLRLELARRFGWRSVRSSDFEAIAEGGAVRLEGRGEGHGVGVCQRGAAWMAGKGASYPEILSHYLPGIHLGR
jgi:stage II sporulation protein D